MSCVKIVIQVTNDTVLRGRYIIQNNGQQKRESEVVTDILLGVSEVNESLWTIGEGIEGKMEGYG